jgi:hypothetical protein
MRTIEDVVFESIGLEDAGVFCEEAEEDTNHKALKVVAGASAVFESVVKIGEQFCGFEVSGVFGVKVVGFISSDEGEASDVFVKFGEGKLESGRFTIACFEVV